ncbi:MAG: glycosyltransferase family 2 protein [Deltaproteobacteria bacterium]|nr:glycosyltransferase family 2 protein [Deltaproteobacteria bacterium]
MKKLSVTVITKNEEDNIARCLESVAFADEIVVFDSGSTDRTVEIAKHYTPRVESTDWPGHVKQKQRAVDAASNDWILAVDADEVVSPPLAASIKNALASGDAVAYELTRKVFTSGNGSTIAVGIRNGEYAFSTGAKPSGAATIRTTVWNAPDGSAVCPEIWNTIRIAICRTI